MQVLSCASQLKTGGQNEGEQVRPTANVYQKSSMYSLHGPALPTASILVCKSQLLKHSQAASGLKIKCPQIKNRKPQVDKYVRR